MVYAEKDNEWTIYLEVSLLYQKNYYVCNIEEDNICNITSSVPRTKSRTIPHLKTSAFLCPIINMHAERMGFVSKPFTTG